MSELTREQIVEENLGLVHSCAHKFTSKGIEYDDLFQAGCIGLIKAVDNFDYDRGVKFSTYAVPVILGEIKRLFRDGGSVKVGRLLKERALKATRIKNRLGVKLGREPTINEIGAELELSPEETAEALAAAMPTISLTKDDDSGGQLDILVPAPEEEISDIIALKEVMNVLPVADRKIIYLRYFKGNTQTQTADILGTTQVQISRKERVILAHLKNLLNA